MNPLTTAALDNKSVEVPIGVNVLTNKKSQNSQKVQAAMTGEALNAPLVDQIDAPGYDGKQAYRDNDDGLYFGDPQNAQSRQIAEVAFDDSTGELVFIRHNKEKISISGFYRQIDFGVGPTGPRGDDGRDGNDGEDGKDGATGPAGCAGGNGMDGRSGPEGSFGIEGEVGATGPYGPLGATGPRGDIGPIGPPGFEGKRGPCGFSCPTTSRGPTGPQGFTMNPNASLAQHPKITDLIWAASEDCLCPSLPFAHKMVVPPAIEPPLPPAPPTIVSQVTKNAPPIPCGAGTSVDGTPEGPKAVTGTYVETTWSDGRVDVSPYDYGGKSCQLIIVPCGVETESGSGSATNYHTLGSTAGLVVIEYATVINGGTAKNSIDVYANGSLVATTSGMVLVPDDQPAFLSFQYDPAIHTERRIKVVVGAEQAGSEWWRYTVNCPVAPAASLNEAWHSLATASRNCQGDGDDCGDATWMQQLSNADGTITYWVRINGYKIAKEIRPSARIPTQADPLIAPLSAPNGYAGFKFYRGQFKGSFSQGPAELAGSTYYAVSGNP